MYDHRGALSSVRFVMDKRSDASLTARRTRLTAWTRPIAVTLAAAVLLVAALVSFKLLLVLIPLLLIIGLGQRMLFNRKAPMGIYSQWTGLRTLEQGKNDHDQDGR